MSEPFDRRVSHGGLVVPASDAHVDGGVSVVENELGVGVPHIDAGHGGGGEGRAVGEFEAVETEGGEAESGELGVEPEVEDGGGDEEEEDEEEDGDADAAAAGFETVSSFSLWSEGRRHTGCGFSHGWWLWS